MQECYLYKQRSMCIVNMSVCLCSRFLFSIFIFDYFPAKHATMNIQEVIVIITRATSWFYTRPSSSPAVGNHWSSSRNPKRENRYLLTIGLYSNLKMSRTCVVIVVPVNLSRKPQYSRYNLLVNSYHLIASEYRLEQITCNTKTLLHF